MTFPPAFLDELRARLPLSEVIGKRLKLTRAGREFKGCCPFHNEKTPSFYVNDDKQFYHCFGCGAHGDIIGFTMRFENLSFPDAIEALAGQAGLPVPQDTPIEREKFDLHKRLIALMEAATVFFEDQLRLPVGRDGYGYLKQRGLSDEAMRRFRLGYAPQDAQALIKALIAAGYKLDEMLAVGLIKKAEDRPDHYSFFRNRVMFPVADRRGQTVAFGGRVMGDGEPKYLNSPDHVLFHKGRLLYGLSRARAAITQGQPLIVVEGYMDVIALVEAGFIGAVAPLGTALTEDQLGLLWKMLPSLDNRDPSRDYSPILCFDGDKAGIRASARAVERALPLLNAAHTARVAYLPDDNDPDELIKESGRGAMQAVLDQSKPMIEVLWNLSVSGRRIQTPEDRAMFQRALRQRVGIIQDEGLRRLYQDDIEKRLADMFRWPSQEKQPMQRRDAAKGKMQRGRFAQQLAGPVIVRKQPMNPQHLREKVLLSVIVNHPELYRDVGDDLGRISFSDPSFEALRQQIVTLFESDSHETIDADGLYRHLSVEAATGRARNSLADMISEATFIHAGFARPDRPIEQARQGWKSIWNTYLQEQLQADLHTATHLWRDDPSDANLKRLMALREQAEKLAQESTDLESHSALE